MKDLENAFTLIELLIVIAIIAILGAATVLVLNPTELISQSRDSNRVADMKTLEKSIARYVVDNETISSVGDNIIYTSLIATSSNCSGLGLPNLPSGWTYNCITNANNQRNIDGTGWIPINFTTVKGGSPLPSLPIDPVNDASSGRYYTLAKSGGAYELTAETEAKKENAAAINSGGAAPGVIRVGPGRDVTPITRDKGLVGYWNFDEGSGTVANDTSGNGNNGIIYNSPSWQTGASCESGSCLLFNGTNNYVNIPNSSSLSSGTDISMVAWINWGGMAGENNFITKENAYEIRVNAGNIAYATNPWAWRGNNTVINPGQWYHVVMVHQGQGNQKIYVNGVEVYNTTSGGNIAMNTQVVTLGARGGGTWSFFNGYIDGVRIYNRALSAKEVLAIYNSQR